MKPKSALPLNRQILNEASAWFVDFRVGDVDAAARAGFDAWLRASPEHIRAYMEIARTYAELQSLRDHRIDVGALVASARAEGNVVPHEFGVSNSERSLSRSRWLQPRALAACIAVAALTSAIGGWFWLQPYPVTYSTEIGENRSISLADGSRIDLNARSRIEIRFSKGERDVDLLEGQALFEVAKDPTRPFIVRSDGAIVRAVGTAFDVNRSPSGTTVTVVEGRVSVDHQDSPAAFFSPTGESSGITKANKEPGKPGATYVSAGEQVTVVAGVVTPPKHADVGAATAWTEHRLIFEATPLNEVVDDFNRYNSRPLIIDDGVLNDFHVSGVYNSTDPTSLIRFLREQSGIQVIETGGAVHIAHR